MSAPLSTSNEPQPKRRRLSEPDEPVQFYIAELVVYDRHSRCQLIDGDYEFSMSEIHSSTEVNGKSTPGGSSEKSPRKPNTSWSTLDSSSPPNFWKGPLLKFRLQWSDTPIAAWVDRYIRFFVN